MAEQNTLQLYNHFLTNVIPILRSNAQISTSVLRYIGNRSLQNHPNPLTNYGGKVYSQNDEDGITFEIIRRIGIEGGVFAEFGVGNGLQNNTLALAAAGWPGFWVGNEDLAFNSNPLGVDKLNFSYEKNWIKKSNIVELFSNGLAKIGQEKCDLVSLDLDGNDYHFVNELLSAGVLPTVFIVEYNAKFIPPIKFTIDYDEDHRWVGDDYFGVSLALYSELFERNGYFLACCNLLGVNAFYVRSEYRDLFSDVPSEIELLYASPKYFLSGLDVSGHPLSVKTIETIFARLNSR